MQYEFKLIILMTLIVAFLFYFSQTKKASFFSLASIYLILILIIGSILFNIGKEIYVNYDRPPVWDFLVFWVNGNAGLSGENFYTAESFQDVALPYDPGVEFQVQIIDTGFWYPPFTMFLFLPLGLLEFSIAYFLWQTSILLLCTACIYVLWKLFLKDHGILSLLLVAMLMLILVPTRSTFFNSQTNFLALLLFLMFFKNKSTEWGGIWLAFCVVVKPYMALLYLYPLLTRKWKMLATAILTLLIITFLSITVFGSDVFLSFLKSPTPNNLPSVVYIDMGNQSLLATILRLTQQQIITKSPLSNPLYLGISLLLTLITVWKTIMIKKGSDDWMVLSILFLALIIYPASLVHYGIFLIVPVVLLLQQSSQGTKMRIVILFIVLITYFLSGYDSGNYTFFANLIMWLVCVILGPKLGFVKHGPQLDLSS